MNSNSNVAGLQRRAVVAHILAKRENSLVVAGLGSAAWDCAAFDSNPLDFLLWGAMGSTAAIGLGLAQAQPSRRILVISGDGDITMGMGSLVAIGTAGPKNLTLIVLDNERYGETGMQISHTARNTDLAGIAKSSGFLNTLTVCNEQELDLSFSLIYDKPGPTAIIIKVRSEQLARILPPRDGVFLKDRFRTALLGENLAHK